MKSITRILTVSALALAGSSLTHAQIQSSPCWDLPYDSLEAAQDLLEEASTPSYTYSCPGEDEIPDPDSMQDCIEFAETVTLTTDGSSISGVRDTSMDFFEFAFNTHGIAQANAQDTYNKCIAGGGTTSSCTTKAEAKLCVSHSMLKTAMQDVLDLFTGDSGGAGLAEAAELQFQTCMSMKPDPCAGWGFVGICGYALVPKCTLAQDQVPVPAIPHCPNGYHTDCLIDCEAELFIAVTQAESQAQQDIDKAYDSYKSKLSRAVAKYNDCNESPTQCCTLFLSDMTTEEAALDADVLAAKAVLRSATATARADYTACAADCCEDEDE